MPSLVSVGQINNTSVYYIMCEYAGAFRSGVESYLPLTAMQLNILDCITENIIQTSIQYTLLDTRCDLLDTRVWPSSLGCGLVV